MKYSIVTSSKTGNTVLLANQIADVLPKKDCLYHGSPDAEGAQADTIFVGFWTDKGSCDETVSAFLQTLHEKKVFLFGTAGFGGSETYYEQILDRVASYLSSDNTVIGRYMCQGRMPASVRETYENLLEKDPQKFQPMIDNFDRALSHPDQEDLDALSKAVGELSFT